MKLSQFLTPDRVTLDAAHGECYRCIDENAKTYTTRRDRAEQAMVQRAGALYGHAWALSRPGRARTFAS